MPLCLFALELLFMEYGFQPLLLKVLLGDNLHILLLNLVFLMPQLLNLHHHALALLDVLLQLSLVLVQLLFELCFLV